VEQIRAAIAAHDWATALTLALAQWRDTRAPELADLVDMLGARCPVPPAPTTSRELHAWWMRHARTYDPTTVTALAATASDRAWRTPAGAWSELRQRYATSPVIAHLIEPHAELLVTRPWAMNEANRIERLAALVAWPDDPRTAAVLARWFVEAPISWLRPCDDSARAFYELLADRIIALGDVRVTDRIAAIIDEPRAKTPELRAHQSELARRVVTELAGRATTELDDAARDQIRAWCGAQRTTAARSADEAALWEQVARDPDDIGVRLVLADRLLEHDDPRGQLITIQCGTPTPTSGYQARRLVTRHWTDWLGDLALVLDPNGSEFQRGMLEVVQVGQRGTPEWAFGKVSHHRELACVRVVRPSFRMTPAQYVQFVLDLPRLPQRLGVTHAVVEALLPRAPWAIPEVEYDHERFRYPRVELARTLELLSRAVPALEELTVREQPRDSAAARELVPHIRELFPGLEHLVIETKGERWEA